MECAPRVCGYSLCDFAFSVVGVCTFLFDWGSDAWAAAELYGRGELSWSGLLLACMLLGSVVVQTFSWFWFQYDRDLDQHLGQGFHVKLSCLLHVLQLGFFCRHISAIRQGFRVWWRGEPGSDYAVYLTHDLSMLRLIETFCESAPQLTLMMTYIMLHTNQARTVQCVSVAASTTSIVWMVVDYHRCLRSFLPDKAEQGWGSAAVYFAWNLLLIAPRVATVALFAAVLPRLVGVHFLLLWPALVLWAWLQRTDFMESTGGEWLYRATVGLIWYFSWFNVAEGRTRARGAIYHGFMAADGAVLLGTWWTLRDPALTRRYDRALVTALPAAYLAGLALKALYYRRFHPTLVGGGGGGGWRAPPPPGVPEEGPTLPTPTATPTPTPPLEMPDGREVTFISVPTQEGPSAASAPPPPPRLLNARMFRHAAHFYAGEGGAGGGRRRREHSTVVV